MDREEIKDLFVKFSSQMCDKHHWFMPLDVNDIDNFLEAYHKEQLSKDTKELPRDKQLEIVMAYEEYCIKNAKGGDSYSKEEFVDKFLRDYS